MGRSFYIYKTKHGYTAEILNPETGARVCFRSTVAKNRDEALLIADRWVREGVPARRRGRAPVYQKPAAHEVGALIGLQAILKSIEQTADLDEAQALRIAQALRDRGLLSLPAVKPGPGNVGFIGFLETFWDYDKSPYVREKLAHGHSIHRSHCHLRLLSVKFYKNYFTDKPLHSVTKQDLKDFILHLAELRKKPKGDKKQPAEKLTAAYRDNIMTAGKTALKWAYDEGLIPADPTAGLKKICGESKKRGILTQAEAEKIFHEVEWSDKRAFTASLIACTTGLRSGEVLALRKSDIQEKFLLIRHSWSAMDKLKTTKTNAERKVNLYPEVKAKILELLDENPFKKTADPFIFYSLYKGQPVDGKILLDGFKDACDAAGIAHKERNIGFHSWRHYWAAYMAGRMEKDKLILSTGHKTKAVFDEYASHEIAENLEEVGKVGAEVFGNILQFKRAV